MCLMHSTAKADEGFQQLRRAGDRTNYERRLAQLAAEDSVEVANGLEGQLNVILSWQHQPVLRGVRKIRIGRHRFYVEGRHSQCSYTLCYIKVFKRDEQDREEWTHFQQEILRALATPVTRVLAPPAAPDE